LCSGPCRLHTGLDATHPSDYIQDCGVPHRCGGEPGEARRWHAAQSTRFGLGRKTRGCARVRVRAALAPVGPGCACTPPRTAATSEHTSSEHSHRSRPERRRETRARKMGLERERGAGRAATPSQSRFVSVLIPSRMMPEKREEFNGGRDTFNDSVQRAGKERGTRGGRERRRVQSQADYRSPSAWTLVRRVHLKRRESIHQ